MLVRAAPRCARIQSTVRSLVAACIMCILAPRDCLAQLPAGTIAAVVHDSAGGVIRGAQVEVIALATHQLRATTTGPREPHRDSGFRRNGGRGTRGDALRLGHQPNVHLEHVDETRSVMIDGMAPTTEPMISIPSSLASWLRGLKCLRALKISASPRLCVETRTGG
jgi:hypothetical protein